MELVVVVLQASVDLAKAKFSLYGKGEVFSIFFETTLTNPLPQMTLTPEAILLFLILIALIGIVFIVLQSVNKQQLHLANIESALKSAIESFDRHLNNIQQSLQTISQEEQRKLAELKRAVDDLRQSLEQSIRFD